MAMDKPKTDQWSVEKHTSGPWKHFPQHIEEGPDAVRAPNGDLICTTSGAGDAKLIAAAPEMLLAGKHLAIKLWETYRAAGQNPLNCQAMTAWMNVARKAEGKSNG